MPSHRVDETSGTADAMGQPWRRQIRKWDHGDPRVRAAGLAGGLRIFEPVVSGGDTFCYDPEHTEDQARRTWLVAAPGRIVVAASQGCVVGTSNMYANRPGPGAHIASGNLMVASAARGRGVGRALLEDMLGWARDQGFDGVQFNAVAASNTTAIRLYERVGFTIIGTVPGGFAHPTLGKVGLHVMFADLAGRHVAPDLHGVGPAAVRRLQAARKRA